jgi:hypothetical protein
MQIKIPALSAAGMLVVQSFVIGVPSSSRTFAFKPERINGLLLKISFPFPVLTNESPKQADTPDKREHCGEYECDLTAPK